MIHKSTTLLLALSLPFTGALADAAQPATDDARKDLFSAATFKGLELRGIGPAVKSGRVGDIAVHPHEPSTYYVAVASGGVWKTVNAGTTWTPVFDEQGSYSDRLRDHRPQRPAGGVGGNGREQLPAQRLLRRRRLQVRGRRARAGRTSDWRTPSTSRGSSSTPATPTWSTSPPRDRCGGPGATAASTRPPTAARPGRPRSRSARTPASPTCGWTPGTRTCSTPPPTSGGATSGRSSTGDPSPGIYKSTDAGETWTKVTNGLPEADTGRIGLAVSPADPDVVYAIVEAAEEGGFYRSRDAGVNWTKMSDYMTAEPPVLQRDHPRPGEGGPGLLHGHLDARDRGRGRDLQEGRREVQARGQPRPLDRPRRHRPPPGGLRRRRLRDLGPGRHLALQVQPAGDAVLPGDRGQRRALLQRLRRHPGQQHAGRPVAHAAPPTASPTPTGS